MSKITKSVGIIASFSVVVQFMKWLLDGLRIQDNISSTFNLVLAVIASLFLILSIYIYQISKDIKKIKKYLKNKDVKTNVIKRMIEDKKASVEPSDVLTLILIFIAFIIYLMWKAKLIPFLS